MSGDGEVTDYDDSDDVSDDDVEADLACGGARAREQDHRDPGRRGQALEGCVATGRR